MQISSPTGITIAIVGGGLGGLAAAIDSHRQGHTVRVFERRASFDTAGDLIGLGRSAQRAFLKWPAFLPRLRANAIPADLNILKYDGTLLARLRDTPSAEGLEGMTLWRSMLHEELYRYAEELGIALSFKRRAVEYGETAEHGWVRFEDGETVTADLVVASDGLASRSAALVVGTPETPTSSGYAIYRVSFPLDHALKDPVVRGRWGGPREGTDIFLAENSHIVIAKSVKTNKICWMLTHKDINLSASESWSADSPASDALPFVPTEKGWAPYIAALIKTTPGNRCVNWKLVWRSPQPRWSSPRHRVLQLGDSCHSFIPHSASGAVMAMEDGYTIAACLRLAGKEKVPLAVQVHNKLRFERVSFAQKMGFETREVHHHPNWETFRKHPKMLGFGGEWVFGHDAEEYACENFDKCAEHILHGTPFVNTNIPEGKVYEPWTIQGLVEEAERKRAAEARL